MACVYSTKPQTSEEDGWRTTPQALPRHMIDPPTRNSSSSATLPSIDSLREDSTQHYIIAFENGSSPNLCGKLSAPSNWFLNHLRLLSRCNVQVSTVIIDEYLTSTSVCGMPQRTLVNLRKRSIPSMSSRAAGTKIHAVLKCTSSNTIWNRDVMAAKNIGIYSNIRR